MLSAKQIAGFLKMWNLKKELTDEVNILHAGKHKSLLQTDSMGMVKNSQSSQK